MTEKKIIDGNTAAADVAYRCSEVSAIYPITPSSTMGELADEWSFRHRKNIWGSVPSIVEMQSEAGAAGALHGALQMGAMATTFTSSQGLLLMIPNMYKIAGEQTPFVMHVAARAVATHALSIFGDHSDVMAVRQTGFAMLSAANVQQAHDMAAIAHAATLRAHVSFLHFFDGFRTSHEVARIDYIDDDTLRKLIPTDLMLSARARGMTPEHPTIRGTSQNPDVFFQSREAANNLYAATGDIVADTMNTFAELTGRKYGLVDYAGAPDAENVIVVMGSASETIKETIGNISKSGVITIHLYRPFPVDAFLAALPKGVKNIAVLDRTKEPGSAGEPLYLDVVAAVKNMNVQTFGGRYGLGSKEFTPRDVRAIYDAMQNDTLHHNFTSGITDDATGLSLSHPASGGGVAVSPATGGVSAILYGIGSDGTVGAAKNIVKIVGENSDLYPQSYAVYDSKKSGGLTASHLRFSQRPIQSEYLVDSADFIGVSSFAIATRIDVFGALRSGGTVMINTDLPADAAFAALPRAVQMRLIDARAHVYFLNANRAAMELGLGHRINTFIMLNFFRLTKILDEKIAIAAARNAIEKTYRKKGADVVAANFAALDRAGEFLHKYELPAAPVSDTDWTPSFAQCDAGIMHTIGEMAAERGDKLPVSAFDTAGEYPVGTSAYEKRGISDRIASVDLEKCIQCGKCVVLCPHAAIRAGIVSQKNVAAESLPPTGSAESLPPAGGVGAQTCGPVGGIIFADCPPPPCETASATPPVGGSDSAEPCSVGVGGYDTQLHCATHNDFKVVPYRTPELGPDLQFTLNVSPADCTGCNICVKNCPVAALKMIPVGQGDQTAFDAAVKLRAPEKLNPNVPKHIALMDTMFQFSGACAGCGETAYIKMITTLFGDHMMIANATGCSSIYGGNLPTTPYAANADGRGPAWSNSLFEDNAEYGLGMRLAINQKRDALRGLLFAIFDDVDDKKIESLFAERDIARQRDNVEFVRNKLSNIKTSNLVPAALSLLDSLVQKSVWIVGGDGWAYDIGYGGLDHVLHSGQNVNILVLDTEGYSNTGGQRSKATPYGASMKFAIGGSDTHKKDLGMIAMMTGAYVAQIAIGADQVQAVRAIREAEAFNGPSVILAYAPCISHGYDLMNGPEHQKTLVDSGAWPLYRFNPDLIDAGKNPLVIDSGGASPADESAALEKFFSTEGRFKIVKDNNPVRFARLLDRATRDNAYRRELKKHLAQFSIDVNK